MSEQIPATIDDAINDIVGVLQANDLAYGQGVNDAEEEAQWIVLSQLYEDIYSAEFNYDDAIDAAQWQQMQAILVKRVESRKPLAYILQQAWFCALPFYVDERVIVPRSFIGEWIAEGFHPWVDAAKVSRVLDLCTGSGCIAITAAYVFENAQIVASDLSNDALAVTQLNIDKHGANERVTTNQGDLFSGISGEFDLILCNPPYVTNQSISEFPDEFNAEPVMAFAAGDTGLDFLMRFFVEAGAYLTNHGYLVVEAGTAGPTLEKHFADFAFTWLQTEFEEQVVFIMSKQELAQLVSQYSLADA